MADRTGIQYVDSTVSPSTGCDGCELHLRGKGGPCYAGHLHVGRLALAMPGRYAPEFTDVRLVAGRMAKAAAWPDLRGKARPGKPWFPARLPRMIFVSDMSDALSAAVPFEFLKAEVVDVATSPKGRRHIWTWLTKRPSRMAEFARWLLAEHGAGWPDNLWAGTSVTSRKTLGRIDHLLEVPAPYHYASLEPLREAVDLSDYLDRGHEDGLGWVPEPSLAWVQIGGESRQAGLAADARPFDVEWARDLIRQCRAGGAAPFVKQLGSNPYDSSGSGRGYCAANLLELRDSHGGDWDEWPADLRVREFPTVWLEEEEVAHA